MSLVRRKRALALKTFVGRAVCHVQSLALVPPLLKTLMATWRPPCNISLPRYTSAIPPAMGFGCKAYRPSIISMFTIVPGTDCISHRRLRRRDEQPWILTAMTCVRTPYHYPAVMHALSGVHSTGSFIMGNAFDDNEWRCECPFRHFDSGGCSSSGKEPAPRATMPLFRQSVKLDSMHDSMRHN